MRPFPSMPTRGRRRRPASRRAAQGQSLVEFALVFPLFFTLVLGLIEFALLFSATLNVNYAARDGALAAVEAGYTDGADCSILKAVDKAVGPPSNDSQIQRVEIYKSTSAGVMIGTATVYTRNDGANDTAICAAVDGATMSYNKAADGYPEASRCNTLNGCDPDPSVTTDSVDTVSVRVTYTHQFFTPLGTFASGGGSSLTFDRASVMRMEPIQ